MQILRPFILLFSAVALAAGSAHAATTAFSPLKAKLESGADAVLLINGDSTAWPEEGPYYKFAKAIGEASGHTVILRRWDEWQGSKPTGPKEYAAPVTLHEGSKPGKLLVYLAALPGATAGQMFAGARRVNALESIPRPDCAILHHGHNMRNFPKVSDDDRTSIRGLYYAALGETSMIWPGVPQVIVTQNPLRDGDQYAPLHQAMLEVAGTHTGITLVDTYAAFVAASKARELYRDNIHPSATANNSQGAQLSADVLLAAWNEASPGPFVTPGWSQRTAPSLIENGDFSEWTDAAGPARWTATLGATATKSETIKYGDAPWSVELRPNGSKIASLQKILNASELDAARGKTISIAILVRASPDQARPYASFVCPVEGKNRTFVAAHMRTGSESWVWLVCAGIPVDADAARGSCYLRILPGFGLKDPESNAPLHVQRVVIVEGDLPAGFDIPPVASH